MKHIFDEDDVELEYVEAPPHPLGPKHIDGLQDDFDQETEEEDDL